MASKFQNRMIGTVVLVAVAVIALPALLDGKKKHYEETFAAIPLVPQAGDQPSESELIPSVTQPLAGHQPEVNSDESEDTQVEVPVQSDRPASPPANVSKPPQVNPSVSPTAETKPRQPASRPTVQNNTPDSTSQSAPPAGEDSMPKGQAWVVQLVALNNAAKANEVVAKLRLSGFRAWSVPSTPIEGKVTRVFVGPDASRAKLESQLAEMKKISGSKDGFVKPWKAN